MPTKQQDALLCMMCWCSEDMYSADQNNLTPPLDNRLSKSYTARAYITGGDCLFRKSIQIGDDRRFYGMILESKLPRGQFFVVIRGTDGTIEWIEDAEYIPVRHPQAGYVEAGFWGIYETFRCLPVAPNGDTVQITRPLVTFVKELLQTASEARGAVSVTTIGHSLGGALATYLGADIASVVPGAKTVVFASPHPGDKAFCDWVMKVCPNFRGWRYDMDLVPKVPLLMGYQHPDGTQTITPFNARARIRCSIGCNHHAVSYMALLDESSLYLPGVLPNTKPYLTCLLAEPNWHVPSPIDLIEQQIQETKKNAYRSLEEQERKALECTTSASGNPRHPDSKSRWLRRLGNAVKRIPHLFDD